MLMKFRTGLFLYSQQRDIFIRQLKYNYLIFENKIMPILSTDFSEDALTFKDKRLLGITDEYFEDIYKHCQDEEDYFMSIETESFHYYHFLKETSYRTLAMWICCTCQLWEQQLLRFLRQEIDNGDLNGEIIPENWFATKTMLSNYGIDIEKMNCWKSISELRDVVNVLKHSEGKSEERLRKNRPDIFLINGKDCLRICHTTLGEVVLNIKMKDLKEYTDALIEFWNAIPTNRWIVKNSFNPTNGNEFV